ncbi:MAG: phosphate ABC transporter permease subunit PstC [Clostridia bacterium]|nr:phosphate ABC transporter permease subunit PstC [Clostridia bacterium]
MKQRGDLLFRALTTLGGLLIFLVVALMLVQMVEGSLPILSRAGVGFFAGTTWDPVHSVFHALPSIWGTLVSSFIGLLIAVPFGLAVAIFLSQVAPRWLAGTASVAVELLAAIPSVVYGYWGIFVLAPLMRQVIEPALSAALGWLPFFQGPPFGIGMLSAGLILSVMVLPTVTAVARDVLAAVPVEQRDAALALGATRWEAITGALLPYARTGLVGAVVLALGRAVGETMAVTMLIGNQPTLSLSLFSPAYSMASIIANEFTEATTTLHVSALIAIGLTLFVLGFVLNAGARLLVWQMDRRLGGARG